MRHQIILRAEAEQDLEEAYTWYEARSTGLGFEFLQCIDACIKSIECHPEMYPVVYKQLRRGVVRRFPFVVLYVTRQDSISIMAIFHAARDPKKWKERV